MTKQIPHFINGQRTAGESKRTADVLNPSTGQVPLADFDVIVLPSGSYDGTISDGLVADLRSWVAGGGTLVTIAEAMGISDAELYDRTINLREIARGNQ